MTMGRKGTKKKKKIGKRLIKFGKQTFQLLLVSLTVIGAITGLYQIDFVRDWIYKPEIKVVKNETVRTGEKVISDFYVVNEGNRTATDIAIIIQGLPTDEFHLFPYVNHENSIQSKTTGQKETLIKIKSLAPNESTSIIVMSMESEVNDYEKEFSDHGVKFNWPKIIVTDFNEGKNSDI